MATIESKELKSIICPLCNEFCSKRLTTFERHLKESHETSSQALWDRINGGPVKCGCGCGKDTKWNGWSKGYSSVVNGHNGSIYAVLPHTEAELIAEKRASLLRGRQGWAAGRTKENDDRIRLRAEATAVGRTKAFETGKLMIWNKGSSAASDKRIEATKKKLKDMFASGEISPWAKGLTKADDPRVMMLAQKVSLTMRQRQIRERLDQLKRLPQEEICERIEKSGQLRVIGGLESYINDAQKIIIVECTGCGQSFQGSLRSLQHGRCFICSPGGSIAQEELAKSIEAMGVDILRNTRKELGGLELDIFIEDKKVAVEYNGLYWHSHVNKTPTYHNNKSTLAVSNGIKLIHIFEDEWRNKRSIVLSTIASRLGLSQKMIGARECTVRLLTSKERKTFFDLNHIDGDTISMISWGLIDRENSIVYALSVRKPFHKKHEGIEVARCCPALGYNVPGGLSRLIKTTKKWAKENGHHKIVTYVDSRLGGKGDGYRIAGFVESGRSPARFWWTDFESRFNRFKYRANSSAGLTEIQVAERAGVVKIWGCENIIFEMIV